MAIEKISPDLLDLKNRQLIEKQKVRQAQQRSQSFQLASSSGGIVSAFIKSTAFLVIVYVGVFGGIAGEIFQQIITNIPIAIIIGVVALIYLARN